MLEQVALLFLRDLSISQLLFQYMASAKKAMKILLQGTTIKILLQGITINKYIED